MADDNKEPAQAEWVGPGLTKRQVRLTLLGVMLAIFLASLDQTIIATAIPRIMAELNGFDRVTWVSTAYIVASVSVVLITGAISDIYGRKWLFVGGLVMFLVGSVLCASSQTMNALIIFRGIQGLGGGMIMALSFVTIGDLFPPAERAKYQGIIAAIFGISSVLGPTLGGFITDQISWEWVFLINIPLSLPVIFLFIRLFPNTNRDVVRRKIDFVGAILIVLIVVPLLLGLSWGGNQYGWSDPLVIGSLALGTIMLGIFFFYEKRVSDPILPIHIFKNRIVGISLLVIFLTGFAMFGGIFFIPLLFQGVLGTSPTASGTFLTPMMLGIVFGAALSGQILSRTGGHYKIQGIIGLSIMVFGVFMLSRIDGGTTHAYALTYAVFMGFGLGTSFPLYTIAIQNGVPQRHIGIATSSGQFFRSVGGSIGLALFGSHLVGRFKAEMQENLPEKALENIPPKLLEEITNNPNLLLTPDASENFMAAFAATGSSGITLGNQIFAAIRESLAQAIGDIFLLTFCLLVLAVIVTAFIKEVPLRGRNKTSNIKK